MTEVSIAQRLTEFMSKVGYTNYRLANEIGMNQTTIGRQLKGEQALSSKLLDGILTAFPDLSAEWLMRGNGEMLLSGEKEESDGDTDAWKAKYEAIKECYDSLLNCLSGMRELKKPRI